MILFSTIFIPQHAVAQTLTELNPLSFGRTVMRNNNSTSEITLTSAGSFTADNAYIFFTVPNLGEYNASGHTANTQLAVNITTPSLSPDNGGAAIFTLVDPFTVPATVTTNGSGEASFFIGATVRSDGSGTIPQNNGNYTGDIIVTITEVP